MNPVFSTAALTKRYRRRTAVDAVALVVYPGEIVGLVGPNGAGKTTLLRLIGGLIAPSAGRIVWTPAGARPLVVRYFGGEQTLPRSATARQWLTMWGSPHAPAAPTRRFGVLSRGTRQRLGLEAILAQAADLILLDEPWDGLDPDASRWLSAALASKQRAGTAIFLSSHRFPDLADVCDRFLFLVHGRLRTEQPPGFQTTANRTAALYRAFDAARRKT